MQKEHVCVSELADAVTVGKHLTISERSDVTVTHCAARRGARAALDEAVRSTFNVDLPSTPQIIGAGGTMIAWAGPDQWLIIEQRKDGEDATVRLKALGGLASLVDVSDSRTIFRVSEGRPSDALVRSMGIDFEDSSFKPGDVAITHVSHLGVMVWRLPDGSGYEFACARTYARDFLNWLKKV
jgi:methylglutamate dehydrogenase subunit D